MLSKAAPVIHDALIIGGGPAGLSAALSLARVCRTSAVFDSGEFRNRGAEAMHSFLSRDGIAPEEFRAIARSQIEDKYSEQVSFVRSKIVKVAPAEILPGYKGFEAVDSANVTYRGKKLVLATGTEDVLPTDIEGYADNWPSHIYQCPFCDGFEQRAYPIGMLTFPNPSYLHFALMVMPFNKDVTIFSNGGVPSDEPTQAALKKVLAAGAKLDDRRVKRLVNNGKGPENGITVEFETGPPAKLGMLLHRPPTRSRAQDLIEQLGLDTKPNGDVIADAMMLSTNVPGCVVAGDTYESIKQALMASSNGLRAAAVISFQLASEDGDRALAEQEAQKGESNL
ncbi:Bifunctional thioredoxin reductase/thioredoxin [Escovopsis weberi]|uniref:Thioredoxin reductase etpT n=1 Tax=Escovopsis weberi TaxID=150374 RepID=ETPT_ESCWE|nr:Bifunctional thioredoxin reductase/thioredoxin [Escovopsis weberi]DAB41654.1 TPA_exp: thioredoxin reductase [Escovopsis weberi]